MTTKNQMPALRSIPTNLIFRHRRLLVGWHVYGNNKNEAWLTELTPSEAASEHTINDKTDWYRTYTSSDGSEQARNDIMDVNEVHHALLEPHDPGSGEAFLNKGRKERLDYLVARYKKVISGRYMYREQEGGQMKAMKLLVELKADKKIVEQRKRKRTSSGSDVLGCDTSDGKRQKPYCGEEDDDDEVGPAIKEEPRDEDTINPALPVSGMTAPELPQGTSVILQPHQEITTAIADSGLNNTVNSSKKNPGVQKLEIQKSAKIDPTALLSSAEALKKTLLNHISQWAESANTLKLDLRAYTGELFMAVDVAGITAASQNILQYVAGYCEHVGTMRAALQQSFEDAKATGMPVDSLRMQEELVERYKECEKELQVVIEELRQWTKRLWARQD